MAEIEYVRLLINEILNESQEYQTKPNYSLKVYLEKVNSLIEEVTKFDSVDFVLDKKEEFKNFRNMIRNWSGGVTDRKIQPRDEILKAHKDLFELRNLNRSATTEAASNQDFEPIETPSFDFLNSDDVKSIVHRDYTELLVNLNERNWKSAMVMSGSILEAILYDALRYNDQNFEAARITLREHEHISIENGSAYLNDLIKFSVRINLIPNDLRQRSHSIIRHFRNLIHPAKELNGEYEINETEANLARHALDSIWHHLSQQ